MSDRLILSDLGGDDDIAKTILRLQLEEMQETLARERQYFTDFEKEAEAKMRVKPPETAGGNNKVGARKNAGFKAIGTAPSINKTPRGPVMVPAAYPTVQDLSNSVGVAKTVRFNGDQVYLLDQSTQPRGKGDETGTGGGIRSGTVNGEVKPVKGSSTVRIEGKRVIRDGDPCTMNGGNNPGVYQTVVAGSGAPPKAAIQTSCPIVMLDTPVERSKFGQWLDKAGHEIGQAVVHPVEGVKGAVKGFANAAIDAGELLLKGATLQGAVEMEESAATLALFGRAETVKKQIAAAGEIRKAADQIDLGRIKMSNAAQEGGDKIAVLVQVFTAVAALARVGLKLVPTVAKAESLLAPGKSLPIATAADRQMPVAKAVITEGGPAGNGVKISSTVKSEEIRTLTAAERSEAFQGIYPYEGVDRLRNIELSEGKRIAQITFREDGRTISEYFTTESAIERVRLVDGSIDATRLNQGLQIHAGLDPITGMQRADFKPFVQIFEIQEKIPMGQAAFGRAVKNPILNPGDYPSLPQLFINSEYHGALRPIDVRSTVNTSTPIYSWTTGK